MDPAVFEKSQAHYYRQFEAAEKWLSDGSSGLNNLILVIGSGSFVLSITFLSGLLNGINLIWPGLLIFSWVFLAFSLILLGWKFLLIQYVADRAQTLTNEWSANGFESENKAMNDSKIEKWKIWKERMGILSLGCMTVGIALLLLFAIANLLNASGGYGHYNRKLEYVSSEVKNTDNFFRCVNSGFQDREVEPTPSPI